MRAVSIIVFMLLAGWCYGRCADEYLDWSVSRGGSLEAGDRWGRWCVFFLICGFALIISIGISATWSWWL
jgi:hypothetical protein